MLDEWVTKLSQDMGVAPSDVAISEILDLARDAAHAVARPAAPITTFIVGYAAGMRGGGRETIAATVREALALIAAEMPAPVASANGNGASHGYGAISGSTPAPGGAPVPSSAGGPIVLPPGPDITSPEVGGGSAGS